MFVGFADGWQRWWMRVGNFEVMMQDLEEILGGELADEVELDGDMKKETRWRLGATHPLSWDAFIGFVLSRTARGFGAEPLRNDSSMYVSMYFTAYGSSAELDNRPPISPHMSGLAEPSITIAINSHNGRSPHRPSPERPSPSPNWRLLNGGYPAISVQQ